MINPESLKILEGKTIYDKFNDKYLVYEKKETPFPYADFRPLGCLNGFMYLYADGYLIKNTLEQLEIAKLYIDVEAGVFREGFDHMYFYNKNILYNISENMNINWTVEFDDDIKDIVVDALDNTYIIFENLRLIRKYDYLGNYIGFYNESEDPKYLCKLHKLFVTDGGGDLYIVLTYFGDSEAITNIDHYDARKFNRIDSTQLEKRSGIVSDDDPYFTYHDFQIDGDYVYIYAENYLEKRNIKMRSLWRRDDFGYNHLTGYMDNLHKITFNNSKRNQVLFFCADLGSSNGYSFGKISPGGEVLWKITTPENIEQSEFNLMIYNSEIFMCAKKISVVIQITF